MHKKYSIFLYIFFCLSIKALPLFDYYEELKDKILHVKCAQLPTPIQRCYTLENVLNYHSIFIKRDDLTGTQYLYGGNKVRKLEFLLAKALNEGAKGVVTFGCVGTNHGLATACYAEQLGLECVLMLTPQPNSYVVCQNLLLDHYFNADIRIFANPKIRSIACNELLQETNKQFYFIPTGGSTKIGCLGYVNAALELKEQINNGVIPEPDYIYLPIGSCGTTAGLLLGLQLAGMHSKIVAVTVQPEKTTDIYLNIVKKLFTDTNQELATLSAKIPLFEFPYEQLIINKNFCGTEYGVWLPNANKTIQLMQKTENITLEGTYSAKALAALIFDIKYNIRKHNEIILIWNTYCGLNFSHLTQFLNYKDLPSDAHCYFEGT